jgi:hypothetical protein
MHCHSRRLVLMPLPFNAAAAQFRQIFFIFLLLKFNR